MGARRYGISLRVFNSISHLFAQVKHERRYSISTSNHVLFCLLYRHTDNDIFDDFPKISDFFSKISEDSPKLIRRSHEHCQTFSENYGRLPKISDLSCSAR